MGQTGTMFDGFMEGFTGQLAEGIKDQTKERLRAEREAARALREEHFAQLNREHQTNLQEGLLAAQGAQKDKEYGRTEAGINTETGETYTNEQLSQMDPETKAGVKSFKAAEFEASQAKLRIEEAKQKVIELKEQNASAAAIKKAEAELKEAERKENKDDRQHAEAMAKIDAGNKQIGIAQQNADANTLRAEKYQPGGGEGGGDYTAATKTELHKKAAEQAEEEIKKEEGGFLGFFGKDIEGGREAKVNKRTREIYQEMIGKGGLLADETPSKTLSDTMAAAQKTKPNTPQDGPTLDATTAEGKAAYAALPSGGIYYVDGVKYRKK